MTILKGILENRNLVTTFVINDLRGRYPGSFVGFLGAFINPLLLLVIYCFVFSGILQIKFSQVGGTGNFAVYLFCGLIPWMAFSEADFSRGIVPPRK